jgi:hypothetical protein
MPWLLAKLAKQQLGSRSLFLIYDGRPGNPFETFDTAVVARECCCRSWADF